MAECELPKLETWVRFPSPAPIRRLVGGRSRAMLMILVLRVYSNILTQDKSGLTDRKILYGKDVKNMNDNSERQIQLAALAGRLKNIRSIKLKKEKPDWADLHIHTLKSDGTYTVEEVFQKARENNVDAIAITDHDTVAGVAEGLSLQRKYGIHFVPGIELSAIYEKKEVHIVALYIDHTNPEFIKKLTYFQKKRTERAKKIISRLKELNMDVEFEDLFEFTENINNAGRLHVAKLLVAKKYARSIKDAFSRFLGENCPAYVAKAKLTVEEALALVRDVNGISILAHPGLLDADYMIARWKDMGLDGIEIFHPDHTYEQMNKYLDIANSLKLLVSGGSDCHGTSKDYTRIGKVRLPYMYYKEIKKYKRLLNKNKKER